MFMNQSSILEQTLLVQFDSILVFNRNKINELLNRHYIEDRF